MGVGYVTEWYQREGFNIEPIWARDQREFDNFCCSRVLICMKFGENCKMGEKIAKFLSKIKLNFKLRIVEDMINCYDLQVTELNLSWKVEFCDFMVTMKFGEINDLDCI